MATTKTWSARRENGTLERIARRAMDACTISASGVKHTWEDRHLSAVWNISVGLVDSPEHQLEQSWLEMFRGWERFAEAHAEKHGAPISDCYYSNEEWARVGFTLTSFLNLDLGPRLDGGLLSEAVGVVWVKNGYTEEGTLV
jgi:hypothetical protein